MSKIQPSEFGFLRLGDFDNECLEHFSYVDKDELKVYRKDVIKKEIYCFAISKNGKRVGSTLADMKILKGEKVLTCLETGGVPNEYRFDKEYFAFYMALAKVEQCKKFCVTTGIKAVEKMAEKVHMRRVFSEYEIEVK
jgi:hypothetical protein